MSNTLEITGTQQVLVTETAVNVVELVVPELAAVVEVTTAGPQGPIGATGAAGATTLAALTDVNTANKVDKSVLFYDVASSKWVGGDANTAVTLTDGGSF
jgi:nitrogenase subunit NifH